MRLLIYTHVNDDYADRNGCDFILVDLTPGRFNWLLAHKRDAEPMFEMPDFFEVSFFNIMFSVVEYDTVEGLDWFNGRSMVQQVPDDCEVAASSQFEPDLATICLGKRGFRWTFSQRHGTVEFQSELVAWSAIEHLIPQGTP